MFEALRGLRDAVAPESGNLGNNSNNQNSGQPNGQQQQQQPNLEELWALYQARDASVLELTQGTSFSTKDSFLQWYTSQERKKDADLVERLAADVLKQSAAVDAVVENLPGMDRTRDEQMRYIDQLIRDNDQASAALEAAHGRAVERRNQCRQFVRDHTSRALGIEEEE